MGEPWSHPLASCQIALTLQSGRAVLVGGVSQVRTMGVSSEMRHFGRPGAAGRGVGASCSRVAGCE